MVFSSRFSINNIKMEKFISLLAPLQTVQLSRQPQACEPVLPEGFVQNDRRGVAQIQRTDLPGHRDPYARIFNT